MTAAQVLVADDDLRIRELLAEVLADQGITATLAGDGQEVLRALEKNQFELILTDLKMPGASGIDILQAAKAQDPDRPVILITAFGTVPLAISAIRQGVYDFIEKPFDPEILVLTVKRALDHFRLVQQNRRLDRTLNELQTTEIIGSGKAVQRLKSFIAKMAPLDITVLIQGETGTGKELVARLIHKNSRRCQGRFLPINCGALPETLLESELFGHEKGAFTGAGQTKKGLVELADGGTLFLDEIHAMPLSSQVKILRFLEEHTFMRVGGTTVHGADVRVVAAANTDLRQEIEADRFREDLFYRLNFMPVFLPPLRDRLEDLPELAYFFLQRAAGRYNKQVRRIDEEVLARLAGYAWPGNIRELENCISSAVILNESQCLKDLLLPKNSHASGKKSEGLPLCSLQNMEEAMIRRALEATRNNRAAAARILGIDTSTLWRKIRKFELQ